MKRSMIKILTRGNAYAELHLTIKKTKNIRMKLYHKLFTSLSLLAFAAGAKAQNEPINIVSTSVPFLRISPDARGGGMGETGLATPADANAGFWNLAKIPFSANRAAIAATYSPWLKKLGLNDVYLATLAGYYKLDDDQALSASLRYFSLGNILFTDNNANEHGSARPREFALDAGYTRKLGSQLSLGLALRYISSNLTGGKSINGIDYRTGHAFAGDLSLFYDGSAKTGDGWSFGMALTNLGSKIGYTSDATQKEYIPANFGIGTAYTKMFDDDNKLVLALDINKLMAPTPPANGDSMAIVNYRNKGIVNSWFSSFGDAPGGFKEELREFLISTGLEYSFKEQFFARTGYFYENKHKGNRRYFTVGFGINYSKLGVNFSYIIPSGSGIDQNPLSNTLRFSLLINDL